MGAQHCSFIDLPLFPLDAVLFPGGRLPLRIFESRYLDMVCESSISGTGFGVCLILQGREVGHSAVPSAVGTVAHIVDFNTGDDGVLGVVAEGGARFRVQRTRARGDGLLRGHVQLWPAESELPLPVEFALLSSILERLIDTMAPHFRYVPRSRYEEAGWVGCRLAELLPLAREEQQHLLELTDPLQRLAALRDILPRFQRG